MVESAKKQYVLLRTLHTPAQISCLAFGHAGHLFVGSSDATLRVYDMSTLKVLKGICGLEGEVSSIVCLKRPGSDLRDAWIAHGQKVSKFKLDSPKMIQDTGDALSNLKVTDELDDVVNELALNGNKSHLAFTLDSGVIGIIALADCSIQKLTIKHDGICGSVGFIPDRPRELVSGGYDTYLIHQDFVQGKESSRRQIDAHVEEGGMGLSPPFITSMTLSSASVIAAGTADGRLLLGFGAERGFSAQTKKAKKWDGLDPQNSLLIKIAEGPIVALTFAEPRRLITSTLMGVITHFNLIYDQAKGSVVLQQTFRNESVGLVKVNTLLADDKRLVVGGFDSDGKGVLQIWKQDPSFHIQEVRST
ncbi:WD40-repeat-containing domain protein [Crepidotus variabilis]|uniref:WD40-repeat-containing domain protein n=1 Tax=Crepidotus variabilis TaxID=179855 RepID=A0A9P6JU70_9AGAR|nr:WD40-repeat-containing domain protein [Crepidotus variabilis]